MKDYAIKYLELKLDKVNEQIGFHETALQVGKAIALKKQTASTKKSLEVLESRLSDFRQQKFEIEEALKWVRSISQSL